MHFTSEESLKAGMAALCAILLAGCTSQGPTLSKQNMVLPVVIPIGMERSPIQLPIDLAVINLGSSSLSLDFIQSLSAEQDIISEVVKLRSSLQLKPNGSQTLSPALLEAHLKTARAKKAEYLFIMDDSFNQKINSSIIEVLDLAILPALVAPSRKINMETRAVGVLLKVDTGIPVFAIQTSLSSQKYSSGVFVERNKIDMAFEQKALLEQKVASDFTDALKQYGQTAVTTAQAQLHVMLQ